MKDQKPNLELLGTIVSGFRGRIHDDDVGRKVRELNRETIGAVVSKIKRIGSKEKDQKND